MPSTVHIHITFEECVPTHCTKPPNSPHRCWCRCELAVITCISHDGAISERIVAFLRKLEN